MVRNYDTTAGASKKPNPCFKGPYEVTRVMRNDRYGLQDVKNFKVTQKPYITKYTMYPSESNCMSEWTSL